MNNLKTCLKCNQQVETSARFCPNCGSSEFREASYDETVVLNPEENPYIQNTNPQQSNGVNGNFVQPQTEYWQSPQPYGYPQQPGQPVGNPMASGIYPNLPQKKGMKWWQIILIVVGALAALLIVFGVIGATVGNDDSNNSTNNNDNYSDNGTLFDSQDRDDENKEFTSGEVKDGSYINEWLNIRFDIPDGYPEGGEDIFEDALASDPGSSLGYCSIDILTGKQLSIVFESATAGFSERTYLEAVVKQIQSQWSESGASAEWSDITNRTIAGEKWTSVTAANISTNGYTEVMCIKIVDNKLCTITMSSDDADEIDTFLNTISKAN